MIPHSIQEIIEKKFGSITNSRSIGGGCIAHATKITCGNTSYFLKYGNLPHDMFQKEAHGLEEIRLSNTITCPHVIEVNPNFLLLEYIDQGLQTHTFFTSFGRLFANMHKHTANLCGFYEDNFIGTTIQKNTQSSSWSEFYLENRIVFQIKCMEQKGLPTKELRTRISQLESRIPSILSGSDNIFSLLHGDLWHGNYIIHNNGSPCLIDPAVYYGNREADLAMTKLFGGFPPEFYEAYEREFPLPEGTEHREGIYRLYHIMNHYTLFGGSYYQQAISLLDRYL